MMRDSDSMYHILLRTMALTLALVLLFVSGVLSPVTKRISDDTGAYLANAIGMNASILPNEINTLSAQLEQKTQELNQREIEVTLKEQVADTGDVSTFVLSVLLFVLLVLILLNYVLDYLRRSQKIILPTQNEQTA